MPQPKSFEDVLSTRRATYDARRVSIPMDNRLGAGLSAATLFLGGRHGPSPGAMLVLSHLDQAEQEDMYVSREAWAEMAHQVDLLCNKDRSRLAGVCMILGDLARNVLKDGAVAERFNAFAQHYAVAQPLAAKIAAGEDVEASAAALLETRSGSLEGMSLRSHALSAALIDESVHQVHSQGGHAFEPVLARTAPVLLQSNKFAQVSDFSRLRRNLAVVDETLAEPDRAGSLRKDLADKLVGLAASGMGRQQEDVLRIDLDAVSGTSRLRMR